MMLNMYLVMLQSKYIGQVGPLAFTRNWPMLKPAL